MIESNVSSTTSETQAAQGTFDISQAIESMLPCAKKLSEMYFHRYGRNYELDDLQGYAHLGLVWAARKYAAMSYDIRQAIDFSDFAEKRIRRNIEMGQSQMSTLHLYHFRMVKNGKMQAPGFVRDTEDYRLSDALVSPESDPSEASSSIEAGALVSSMLSWLRTTNPAWAQVVEMRMQGLTDKAIERKTGMNEKSIWQRRARAMKALRERFASC